MAITPNTRVVFLTNPNNPTGVAMSADAIRTVAKAVPPEAIVLVDEAYAEFSGATFIPEQAAFPNVIVGRTFAKAHGLAGLRVGTLVGASDTLAPVRRAIGVYSVNVAAVVALQAALQDRQYVANYLEQVRLSKALVELATPAAGDERNHPVIDEPVALVLVQSYIEEVAQKSAALRSTKAVGVLDMARTRIALLS